MSRKSSANVAVFLALALLLFTAGKAFAMQAKSSVPLAVQQAFDLGSVDPEEDITLTVQLKMTNQQAFDRAVDELYNPESPTFEHWMTDAQLQAYAPSPGAMAVVKAELVKNGLSVLSVDPLGFSVRVHGTLANVQKAFQTQIHQYTFNKSTFRAHLQAARLTGGADAYVHSVAGLDSRQARSMMKRAVNPKTGKPAPATPVAKLTSIDLNSILTDHCFTSTKTFTFITGNTALPFGNYFGNDYDDTDKVCSFTPAQLQAHYGLPAAYAKGFDGSGQTVVIVDAFGYPTAEADANAFSALNGLPALDASNFEVVYPQGPPRNPNAGILTGWDFEIAIDVQWAHSIAPKAKIVLVAAAAADNEDMLDAISYAVNHKLGNSISNSWEVDTEQFAGPVEVNAFNTVLARAAAQGVSVNFSSGDSGDDNNGSPIGAPEVPADSPYATAVGGTAILNKVNGKILEVGWGNVQTLVNDFGPFDPPLQGGFIGGGGGGESVFFAKPSWQAALPGTGRQVPDVAALADPYTGVFIEITQTFGSQPPQQYVSAGWGGTSVSCPIFSAFWTLANQAAGHSLGQAAPHLSRMTSKQLIDIVPVTSPFNIAGTVFDAGGPTNYSPFDLLSQGIFAPNIDFVSAMWPITSTFALVQGFELDTTLATTKGWDNVTGFGVPNGLGFIQGAGR